MPAKSAAQYRLMQAVAHGVAHIHGLSKNKAKEFTQGVRPSSLPEKAKKKGK